MAIRKVGIIAIVIFGAFVLGMVPFLTKFSSVNTTSSSIETRQGSRVPSEASRATIASPLELPAATSDSTFHSR